MPLNFDPNKLQDAMKTLFQGSGPNPLFDSPGAQPPPQAPAPQSGALAASMSQPSPAPAPTATAAPSPSEAGAAALYGNTPKPPMSMNDFAASNPDTAAYVQPRPVGDFDKLAAGQPGADSWANRHNELRRGLASVFAGLAEFGRPGAGQAMESRWLQQSGAQRAYDDPQNQERMKRGAIQQAYQAYLQQQGEGATIQHTQQETENLAQNSPAAARKSQFAAQLQQEAESGKWDPPSLKARALRMAQFNRVVISPDEIDSIIQGTKPLGSKFTLTRDPQTQAPIELVDRQGNHYSQSNLPKDPEAHQMWNDAATAAGQKEQVEEDKEKRVAGFAATRQAQAFSNQQEMENTKKMQPAVDTALTADQRLARMEKSYEKAKGGDQQAMLALLADHLGMTFGMQKGAKLNRGLIEEAQQSQPWLAKIGAKFDDKGYLSGVALGPEQMKQMLDLGYDARDQAWKGAHDAATTYGVQLPPGATKVEQQRTPGDKRLLQQGGQGGDVIYARDPQGQLHKAAKGTALPQGWKAENAPATK